ncbi:MAG: hypothetical protein PF517_14235 [Salinivirgaceae bacterium]|jgi:hypothetical protein|nr:hypothetical protein [Salinivirgaceae bacterium]
MDINKLNKEIADLNKVMIDNNVFFEQFGNLDDIVYADGAIPKKY